jgi:IrrE N-terminal-like domain
VLRGFKTMAKKLGLQVRAELGLDAFAVFDPYALARLYGIRICPIDELQQSGADPESIAHFANAQRHVFDAALIPHGGGSFVIENTVHARTRRRATISHEMAHVILEHEFDTTLINSDGCRAASNEIESQATWFGGELLLPYDAAIAAARADLTDNEVAAEFDISKPLAAMRMNASGVRKIIDRQRQYRLVRSR